MLAIATRDLAVAIATARSRQTGLWQYRHAGAPSARKPLTTEANMTLFDTRTATTSRNRTLCLIVIGFGFAASVLLPAGAEAQVVSQGRGTLTLLVGQGSSPVGGIATEVADQTRAPMATQHSVGWRVAGGYNFADFFAFEAGIGRIGYAKGSAPYKPSASVNDEVDAKTALNVIEANLVGRAPLARGLGSTSALDWRKRLSTRPCRQSSAVPSPSGSPTRCTRATSAMTLASTRSGWSPNTCRHCLAIMPIRRPAPAPR